MINYSVREYFRITSRLLLIKLKEENKINCSDNRTNNTSEISNFKKLVYVKKKWIF